MSSELARISRAEPRDAATLAALAAGALPEPWSEVGFAAELGRSEARIWLARGLAAEGLGYLAAHRVLEELQVLSLAVAAGRRRRGIGRALLEHAVASEPGLAVVHLEVRSNDAAAQAFYRCAGFRRVGLRRGFYPDGVDALLLARSGSAGASRLAPRGASFPRGVPFSGSLSILSDLDRLRRLWSSG